MIAKVSGEKFQTFVFTKLNAEFELRVCVTVASGDNPYRVNVGTRNMPFVRCDKHAASNYGTR